MIIDEKKNVLFNIPPRPNTNPNYIVNEWKIDQIATKYPFTSEINKVPLKEVLEELNMSIDDVFVQRWQREYFNEYAIIFKEKESREDYEKRQQKEIEELQSWVEFINEHSEEIKKLKIKQAKVKQNRIKEKMEALEQNIQWSLAKLNKEHEKQMKLLEKELENIQHELEELS